MADKQISLADVDVSFARRDITQATDAELKVIRELVIKEKARADEHGGTLDELIIESEYVDKDWYRYRTSVSYYAKGSDLDAEVPPPVV